MRGRELRGERRPRPPPHAAPPHGDGVQPCQPALPRATGSLIQPRLTASDRHVSRRESTPLPENRAELAGSTASDRLRPIRRVARTSQNWNNNVANPASPCHGGRLL